MPRTWPLLLSDMPPTAADPGAQSAMRPSGPPETAVGFQWGRTPARLTSSPSRHIPFSLASLLSAHTRLGYISVCKHCSDRVTALGCSWARTPQSWRPSPAPFCPGAPSVLLSSPPGICHTTSNVAAAHLVPSVYKVLGKPPPDPCPVNCRSSCTPGLAHYVQTSDSFQLPPRSAAWRSQESHVLRRKPSRSTACSLTPSHNFLTREKQCASEPLDHISSTERNGMTDRKGSHHSKWEMSLFLCNQKQTYLLLHTKPVEVG